MGVAKHVKPQSNPSYEGKRKDVSQRALAEQVVMVAFSITEKTINYSSLLLVVIYVISIFSDENSREN
jgi:hypothetical protein